MCQGMPYTGVKGEFEVVGFTTLTYVLVLVGTYGAFVSFALPAWPRFAFTLTGGSITKTSGMTKPISYMPCRLCILHSGADVQTQGIAHHTHVLVSRLWQHLMPVAARACLNRTSTDSQDSAAPCSLSRWPCWRSCPLGSGQCRYCRGEQPSPYWVRSANVCFPEHFWQTMQTVWKLVSATTLHVAPQGRAHLYTGLLVSPAAYMHS
jgi:hypothetical protein